MTDLDRVSLDRILPSTPGPADWNDVMRRSRQSRRRHVVAFAVAVLVVAVGTASALGTVRDFFLDRGFIGLPPQGATPSTPDTGELVLSAYAGIGGRTRLWVYADGRMIWQRDSAVPEGANKWSSGYLEQRLTIEGVERMRAEAISSGLFAHDSYLSVHDAPCFNFIEVRDGDRRVSATWRGSRCPPSSPGEPGRPTTATEEEERELLHLVGRLTNPTTWLPASAWEERESRAYVPSRFAIGFGHRSETLGARLETVEPSRILALLPDSAEELLAAKPRTRSRHFYGGPGSPLQVVYDYTSQVTTEEARTLSEAFDRAGLERKSGVQAYALSYVGEMPTEGQGAFFYVSFEPILPHGEYPCSPCG